jgi:hypothetical protein
MDGRFFASSLPCARLKNKEMDKQLGNKVLPHTTVLYPSLGHRACALGRDLSLIRIYSMTGRPQTHRLSVLSGPFDVVTSDVKGIDTTSDRCET